MGTSIRPMASCGVLRSKGRRPRVPRWGACGVLLLLLVVPHALAGPTEPTSELETLEREYVEALQDLFRWCRSAHLNRTAEDVARELLELDPDHETARRWLRHKRRRGTWVTPKRPPERTDRSRAAKERYLERRAERLDVLVDRYWEAYEGLEGDEHEAERRRIHAIALDRWPRDARFRKAGGEVQRDGLWILRESARSDAVAERLQRAARGLLDVAPKPRPATLPVALEPYDFVWRGAGRCGRITVVSRTSAAEAERVARHCYVAAHLFRLVFGVDTDLPVGYSVALGSGDGDFQRYVDGLELPDHMIERLRRSSGMWSPGQSLLFASSWDEEHRLDSAVWITVDVLRERAFGDSRQLAWLPEAISTYLTWLVCGTRLSSFGSLAIPTRTSGSSVTRDLGDDWLAGARRLAAGGRLPELAYVFAVDKEAMTWNDLLAAYAFGAYLITGHSGRAQRFLHACDAGRGTPDACEAVLGLTLPRLEERFHRWLRECH